MWIATQLPDTIECPHCPKTWDRDAEMHNQPAVSACAQHIVQSQDHPNSEFSAAKDQVLRYNEQPEGADAPDERSPMNVAPPGGTTVDLDDDPARTMPDVPNTYRPSCPECGAEMSPTTSGAEFTGTVDGKQMSFVSDGDDHICHDCGVLLSSDNTTVTGVTA